MGSGFATCGLSNLPIPNKTPSLLLLLTPGSNHEDCRAGVYSPTGLWRPTVRPYRGVYNDDRHTIDLKDVHRPDDEWRDIGRNYGEKLNDFLDRVQRGEVFSPAINRKRPIGMCVVREDIWETLLHMKWDGFLEPVNRSSFHSQAEIWLDRVIGQNPINNVELGLKLEELCESEHMNFIRHLYQLGLADLPLAIERIHIMHDIASKKINRGEALEILQGWADVVHISTMMCPLRRAWSPMPGLGSQSVEWALHAEFAEQIRDISLVTEEREKLD